MVSGKGDREDLDRASLKTALSGAFSRNLFNNRYTLHPSQLDELAETLCESVASFIATRDGDAVTECGATLAHYGLGIQTIMDSIAELHHFGPSAEITDAFALALASGFVIAREGEILSSQEQLRRALASTLDAQSRELHMKNQAIESSVNGILFADIHGRITYVNRSFLSISGYADPGRIMGRGIDHVWTDGDAHAILAQLTQSGEWRGELIEKRTDGTPISVAGSASYIRDRDGRPIGIMASFVDVTESKRLEIEMQQIQKMDDLGQLASGIVHDFNNLLAAIGGYLQLVLLDATPGDRNYRDLLQIKAAVDRGAGLTSQLAYFTRQTSGKRHIVNLNDVARETYEILSRTFSQNIVLELKAEPHLWTIEADPNQMSQVIMNLCVNARDAIVEKELPDQPGGPGRVTIETSNVELSDAQARQYVKVRAGRYVALRVVDTGTGIHPQVRKRLFVPFVTTKKATSGTGLGLAVVYGIVRGHQGFIDVESEDGVGTTFSVFLPMVESGETEDREAGPELGLIRGSGTLLVVDDDPAVREVVVRALALSGYRVFEAGSGRHALEVYRERAGTIDLVILDMVMPDMDGQVTLDHLRGIDPQVSALFMTGHTSDARFLQLAREGRVEVIEKPVDLRRLSERVRAATERPRG